MRRTCSSRCASERSRRSSFSCSSWSSTRRSTDIGGPPPAPAERSLNCAPSPLARREGGGQAVQFLVPERELAQAPHRLGVPADVLGGEFLERVHAAVLVE